MATEAKEKYFVVVAVMLAAFMEVMDTAVVNVSLPHIAGNLSATVDEATWVITSYIVANAIMIPLNGWLTHYVGRKRLLMIVVSGFTISSMLCGFAPTLPLLVAFRVMQGITGGGLQPLSMSILLEMFPNEERQKGLAIWGFGMVFAPILGPTLGGWLTDTASWRWVFFINLPVCVLALLFISAYVHDPAHIKRRSSRIDVMGIILLVFGMGSLQTVFDKGQQDDWFSSPFIVALSVVAGVALTVFIVREWNARDPLVRLRLFKERNFVLGAAIGMVMYFVLFGSLILMPLFMQTVLGWPAVTTGLWTGPRGIGSFLGMFFFQFRFSKRIDPRVLVTMGFAATGLVFVEYGRFSMYTGVWNIVIPQIFQGFAMVFAFIPLTALSMAFIKNEEIPYASSLSSTVRNIGSSLGISCVGTFLARHTQVNTVRLGSQVYAGNPVIRQWAETFQHALGIGHAQAMRLAMERAYAVMQAQANALSFIQLFQGFSYLFIVILPIAFFMKRPLSKRRS
jgi:DHA2 family multidrug resistance protein